MEDNDFFDDASASGASLTSGDEDELFDVNNDDGAKNDNNNNNVVDDFNKTNVVDNESNWSTRVVFPWSTCAIIAMFRKLFLVVIFNKISSIRLLLCNQ